MDKPVVISIVRVTETKPSAAESIARQLVGMVSFMDRLHPGVRDLVFKMLRGY